MDRRVFGIGVIFIILGSAIFFGTTYEVNRSITEDIRKTVRIPYNDTITVVKTETVYDKHEMVQRQLYVEDFNILSQRTVLIEWSSTQPMALVGVMKTSTWNRLWQLVLLEFGVTVAAAVLSGGTIGSALASQLPMFLASTIALIVTADDYYQLNSQQDSMAKSIPGGNYKVIIINLNVDNNLDAIVKYEYESTEIITKYREEEQILTETRIIKEPILAMQNINGLSWVSISYVIIILSILLLGLSFIL